MKRNIIILLISLCVILSSCYNPIMEKWWLEEDDDPDYIAILKNVPLFVYETIVETEYIYETVYMQLPLEIQTIYVDKPVPPEVLLQHITINNIEFIVFAGNSDEYNGPPGIGASTSLTIQEKNANDKIVDNTVSYLKSNSNDLVILHGHANITLLPEDPGYNAEIQEIMVLSYARAMSVRDVILNEYTEGAAPQLELIERMTAKGYGGGMNYYGSSSIYSGLNRRVEVISFTIETVQEKSDK